MVKEQQWTSQYFLAADENMQLDVSCTNLTKMPHTYSFLVRTTCIEVLGGRFGTVVPFQMIVTLEPKTQAIAIQLDIVDWSTVNPTRIKDIVEMLQTSPQLAQKLLACIGQRIDEASGDKAMELMQLKQFYLSTLPTGITHYSTSKQATDMVYLFDMKAIQQSAKFAMSEKGGKLRFTFKVGFTQQAAIQIYEVSCIMYLFIKEGKLGYYFEFYLDESNFHHQDIYNALPDQLMDNERFLFFVASVMEAFDAKEQHDHLQRLIAIFKASM